MTPYASTTEWMIPHSKGWKFSALVCRGGWKRGTRKDSHQTSPNHLAVIDKREAILTWRTFHPTSLGHPVISHGVCNLQSQMFLYIGSALVTRLPINMELGWASHLFSLYPLTCPHTVYLVEAIFVLELSMHQFTFVPSSWNNTTKSQGPKSREICGFFWLIDMNEWKNMLNWLFFGKMNFGQFADVDCELAKKENRLLFYFFGFDLAKKTEAFFSATSWLLRFVNRL